MWLGLSIVLGLASDPVALVHADLSKASAPLFLTRHSIVADESGGGTEGLAAPNASLLHFYAGAGKKPASLFCALDLNGDGNDEIAVARNDVAKGKSEILIVGAPTTIGVKKSTLLASTSKKEAALQPGSGELVAIGRFARAGVPTDDLVLVHRAADGSQTLELRTPPGAKKKPLGAAWLTLDAGISTSSGEVIGAFGLNVDGAPGDELMLVRAAGATSSIEILAIATDPIVAATSLAIVSLPSDVRSVVPTRIGDTGEPGLLLMRALADGDHVETRTLSASGALGDPSLDSKPLYASGSLYSALSIRLAPPPPPGGGGSEPPPPPPPQPPKPNPNWEIVAGSGSLTYPPLKVQMSLLTDGWKFTDAVGVFIEVHRISGTLDNFKIQIKPPVFTLMLTPKGSTSAALASLNVWNPNASGGGGINLQPYTIGYKAGFGNLGTLAIPAGGSQTNFEWIGFRVSK